MTLWNLVILILVLLALGSLPTWPHSQTWGYAPSGSLTLLLVVVLMFLFLRRR